jgi:hypothetical protein
LVTGGRVLGLEMVGEAGLGPIDVVADAAPELLFDL